MSEDLALPISAARLIPHQPPMALVDRLLSCDESGGGVAEATLPANGPWLGADGTLEPTAFIELMAQSYALVQGYLEKKRGKCTREGFLVGISRIEFLQTARAGDRLTVTVKNLGGIGPFSMAWAEVRHDAQLIATGSVKVWVVDRE